MTTFGTKKEDDQDKQKRWDGKRKNQEQEQEDQLYSKFDKKEEEIKNEDERDGGNVW